MVPVLIALRSQQSRMHKKAVRYEKIPGLYITHQVIEYIGYTCCDFIEFFYRAMHFSAKRSIAIACRLSNRLSVCLSVTLVNCDHIGWNFSKIISPLISLGRSLFATPT